MAPPSQLRKTTSVLERLVKEEASYHKELAQQEARIKQIKAGTDGEHTGYYLKQERQAVEETKNIFPAMHAKISQAIKNLEDQLASNKEVDAEESAEEVTMAKEAIAAANKTLNEAS
ncbi:tubulin binding cofactor A [Melanomma pulvis-pyrius CBS 109.77]|uniref:Tubulin-specific chaperone A n=1 Tax=Melanomma pulvis-pyrius CBS 109.77 TaxID=1314802 RepID=A0A6A6X9S6_9PLEO|nr:tubulin binding cofactor A [Melanomma pulvis-pyrius CBS 109.77]